MEEAAAGDGGPGPLGVRARHIKKRALKNKTLSVSFNEKDLKDFVTGFHKRKKKRRKEALQKQEEADRRKRIEQRKKNFWQSVVTFILTLMFQRKLERDFVMFGGAPPDSGTDAPESDGEHDGDEDEDGEPVPSVSDAWIRLGSIVFVVIQQKLDIKYAARFAAAVAKDL
ncbi:UNVERIFIED_CONTAM: hypothetical protein Sradi_6351900 [Sesamum radiatum]|uniref:Ribosomal RNA-processing protein 17 n=1 Tax=Sesamum radiatum TaxID=300843 RepID=A0AAW2K245_SESRA